MALFKCGECKQKISTQAAACPHCGAPVDPAEFGMQARRDRRTKWAAWIVFTPVVLLLVIIIAAGDSDAPPANAESQVAGSTAPVIDSETMAPEMDRGPEAMPPEGDDARIETDPYAARRAEFEAGPDLGMSTSDFASRFNANLNTVGLQTSIDPVLEGSKAVASTFNADIRPNMALVGSVKPASEKVVSVMLIAGGDGTAKSGARIMLVAGALYAAAGLADDVYGATARIVDWSNESRDSGFDHVVDGVNYSFSQNEYTGNSFAVEAAGAQ